MFGIPLNRIRRQIRRCRGFVESAQCSGMDEENLNSPTAISSGSGTSATQRRRLSFPENDTRASTASICAATPDPSEVLTRAISVIPRDRINGFARSSLAFYVDWMYKIGICPHSENQVETGGWRNLQKVSSIY